MWVGETTHVWSQLIELINCGDKRVLAFWAAHAGASRKHDCVLKFCVNVAPHGDRGPVLELT